MPGSPRLQPPGEEATVAVQAPLLISILQASVMYCTVYIHHTKPEPTSLPHLFSACRGTTIVQELCRKILQPKCSRGITLLGNTSPSYTSLLSLELVRPFFFFFFFLNSSRFLPADFGTRTQVDLLNFWLQATYTIALAKTSFSSST